MKKRITWHNCVHFIMRISIPFVIVLLLAEIAYARNGFAQEVLNRKVSIEAENMELKTVLGRIGKSANVRFSYVVSLVSSHRVTVSAKNERLEQVLERVLQPLRIEFYVSSDLIVLNKKSDTGLLPDKTGLSNDTEVIQELTMPDKMVSGQVLADNGEALPGVNITIKGTTTGSSADVNGKYVISVPNDNAILVFSFVGFVSREVPVNGRSQIDVKLFADTKALEEVVVVGYGSQRKIETTGAIATVKSDELLQTPISNFAQGLQARVSGVQITQNSGTPGGNISVRIRGTNSINGSSEPLYIVDGIQISNGGGVNDVSPLSSINPNDIETIEVLKDASAAAVYGSRAANGVVLITTKSGKSGPTKISYEGYYGVQKVNKLISMMNATEFAQLENEIFKNKYYPNPESLGEGTNWQKLIFREAPIQNHQLTISGGSEKTKFSIGANYFNQDGIIINSKFSRYSFRINLENQATKWLRIGTTIMASRGVTNVVPTGSTNLDLQANQGILGAALSAPPVLSPYDAAGNAIPFDGQFDAIYRESRNPLLMVSVLNRNTGDNILGNLFFEAKPLKGLTYRASFNTNKLNSIRDIYSPRSFQDPQDLAAAGGLGGSANKFNTNNLSLLHESILTYSLKLAKKHNLNFTAVYSAQVNTGNVNVINAQRFPNDATLNEALQLATQVTVTSNRSEDKLLSYTGRVNYGYKDKIFLSATARVDGLSKFGTNNKYGLFPAVSAAWRLIEEPFFQRIKFVSDLKLRASYGVTGNAAGLSPYQSLALVGSDNTLSYPFNHVLSTGISPTGVPNPDLRWEKSKQSNVGLDFSFLKNRFSLVVDMYYKKTDDLLFTRQLPMSAGYATISGNFAALENKGIEFAGKARVLEGPLKWNVSGNISFNRNKLLALTDTTSEYAINNYNYLKVGEQLGLFKTYVFDGIYQTGEAFLPGSDSRVGGTKLKDLNNDGKISAADQKITGRAQPKFTYGITTDLQYKNFDLSAFFSGVAGNQIYNLIRYTFENPAGRRNLYQQVVNRWTPTNPNNEYAGVFIAGKLPISDRFVENGSYVRCKNLTLGYTFPKSKFISRARIYVSANNLFTWTKYSGYDPEVNTFGNSNTQVGIDNLVYPVAKSFLGGVQLYF
jgi:TonB-dependent starch-binding outer membrane protein SusC